MQSPSLLCCSDSLSPVSISQRLKVPFRNRCVGSIFNSSFAQVPFNCSLMYRRKVSPLYSTATQEIVETSKRESEFIEIGYICSVHGLQGEVRVKSSTDFPELRFSEPGRRWLRQQVSGREKIQEVELVDGRGGHTGQKSWIVKFSKVETIDQAQQLVGSTILITEEDRPELEEGEFYSRDLVGMRVSLKETGEPVGTVINVFNSGASDLLHVMLDSSIKMLDGTGKPKSEIDASGPFVWVPFVEAIVPSVDMNKRELLITPPKGLLELNIRSDERSKKERRQLEWKQRKKFQQRLIRAKKKLCELEQQHVFHGFRYGEKAQRNSLADQIVGVNSKLLGQALQNIEIPSKRGNATQFIRADFTNQIKNTLRISKECLTSGSGEKLKENLRLQEKGQLLTSKGQVAIVLVMDDSIRQGSTSDPNFVDSERIEDAPFLLQQLLSDDQRFVRVKDRSSVPLIVVCPAHAINSLQNLFSNCEHFSFNSEKVWFLEEEKLPVVSSSLEEQNKHKILMKSPWEILQTPVGSGGVINLLSSNSILESLGKMGVEYIEVCSINERNIGRHTLLGLVNSCEANVGIQIIKDTNNFEENFDIIFSMKFMQQLTKQISKLHFEAIPNINTHVEKVGKEWIDVIPSSPNSFEFRCSIYSSLKACPTNKLCVMEVTD